MDDDRPSTGPSSSGTRRWTRRDRFEVAAALSTGLGHLATAALGLSVVFVPLALVGWAAYLGRRLRHEEAREAMGLGRSGLAGASRAMGALGGLALVGMALWGWRQGRLVWTPSWIPLLALYPVWGVVQQTLVQGLVVRHLADRWPERGGLLVVAGAVLFGLVHVPSWDLAALTFAFGLAATPVYLRWRSVWPLGLAHGWLGAAAYLWVLGRDPWVW